GRIPFMNHLHRLSSHIRSAGLITVDFPALIFCSLRNHGQEFNHPCIPTTLEELDTIKANLDKQPWKSGYAALAADGRSQLTYVMAGPFEVVRRNPNENLWPWRGDMSAVYNLAR